nr:putative vacuolar membrane protein [Quercus suber]
MLLPVMLLYTAVTTPEALVAWRKDVTTWLACGRGRRDYAALRQDDGSETTSSPRIPALLESAPRNEECLIDRRLPPAHLAPFTIGETARQSFIFSWLWFAANYTIAASFEYSSVATSTVLTSCSGLFTLGFGYYLGVHSVSKWKLAGVVGSIFGIFLIYYTELFGNNSDEDHRGDFPDKTSDEKTLGALFALLSAALYGYYSCLMKKNCVDETRINMLLFFGFVGLFNVIFLWPIFLVLHYTHIESFQLPPTTRIAAMVVSNSLISGASDMLWASAVLMTSPVLVTVGLSLSIPLALIGQFFTRSQTPTALYVVGTLLVMAAVYVVEIGEQRDGETKGEGMDGPNDEVE